MWKIRKVMKILLFLVFLSSLSYNLYFLSSSSSGSFITLDSLRSTSHVLGFGSKLFNSEEDSFDEKPFYLYGAFDGRTHVAFTESMDSVDMFGSAYINFENDSSAEEMVIFSNQEYLCSSTQSISSEGFTLLLRRTNNNAFQLVIHWKSGEGCLEVVSSKLIFPGTWTFVGFSFRGTVGLIPGRVSLYIGGIEVGKSPYNRSNESIQKKRHLLIGSLNHTRYFVGKISNPYFVHVPLTPKQVSIVTKVKSFNELGLLVARTLPLKSAGFILGNPSSLSKVDTLSYFDHYTVSSDMHAVSLTSNVSPVGVKIIEKLDSIQDDIDSTSTFSSDHIPPMLIREVILGSDGKAYSKPIPLGLQDYSRGGSRLVEKFIGVPTSYIHERLFEFEGTSVNPATVITTEPDTVESTKGKDRLKRKSEFPLNIDQMLDFSSDYSDYYSGSSAAINRLFNKKRLSKQKSAQQQKNDAKKELLDAKLRGSKGQSTGSVSNVLQNDISRSPNKNSDLKSTLNMSSVPSASQNGLGYMPFNNPSDFSESESAVYEQELREALKGTLWEELNLMSYLHDPYDFEPLDHIRNSPSSNPSFWTTPDRGSQFGVDSENSNFRGKKPTLEDHFLYSNGLWRDDPPVEALLLSDLVGRRRANEVRKLLEEQFGFYAEHAFAFDEINVNTGEPNNAWGGFAATLVDSIDTLKLAGLENEFERCLKYLEDSFDPTPAGAFSLFETNIRILGGLLSTYALHPGGSLSSVASLEEKNILHKAASLADSFAPAFQRKPSNQLPGTVINLRDGTVSSQNWLPQLALLADFGTLTLEQQYLSMASGVPRFFERIKWLYPLLGEKMESYKSGMLPVVWRVPTGEPQSLSDVSVGSYGDSFYEYLLKSWLLGGRKDASLRHMYDLFKRDLRYLVRRSLSQHILVDPDNSASSLLTSAPQSNLNGLDRVDTGPTESQRRRDQRIREIIEKNVPSSDISSITIAVELVDEVMSSLRRKLENPSPYGGRAVDFKVHTSSRKFRRFRDLEMEREAVIFLLSKRAEIDLSTPDSLPNLRQMAVSYPTVDVAALLTKEAQYISQSVLDNTIPKLVYHHDDLLYVPPVSSYAPVTGRGMEALSCFLPGSLALAAFNGNHPHAQSLYTSPNTPDADGRTNDGGIHSTTPLDDLIFAKSLMYTCVRSFLDSQTGLPPDTMEFLSPSSTNLFQDFSTPSAMVATQKRYNESRVVDKLGKSVQKKIGSPFNPTQSGANMRSVHPGQAKEYRMRPETVESLFILHQLTGNPIYREWGWIFFQSLRKYTKNQFGYGQYPDVEDPMKGSDGKSESFFMGETLKYFYLLFSPDHSVSLEKYVFNTEAHPFSIPIDPSLKR